MSEQANTAARYEHEIPEGYEARIDSNKVIIELKENEDERIRNEILVYIGAKLDIDLETHNRWCSYLERQKEQKPAEWSEEDKKNRYPLRDGEIKVGDIITYFKNGKKGIMLVSSFDSGIYPRCKWGISHIDETAYGDWAPGSGPYYVATEKEKQQLYDTMPKEIKDWLKSLRPQPKQEWSHEDEMNLYNIIEAIKYTFDVSEGSSGSRLITWLKSRLHPQPHWKPSEVQMEALAWYSGNSGVPPTGDKAIKSLYIDLQKLL